MDNSELLKRLMKIDPKALADAHDELIDGFDEKGQPISLGDPVFEIDGGMHRVPFNELREALQKRESKKFAAMQQVFKGRIPKSVVSSPEMSKGLSQKPRQESENDDGYYWDKNYNYEYMNPEAEKQKVLGKVKK